jgi:hypothetical protein
MALELRNQEWLDQNSNRRYPLAVDASCVDVTGAFTLPTSFIVALYLNMPPSTGLNPAAFFVQQVGVFSTGCAIRIAYWNGSTAVAVASALIARAGHTRYREYRLTSLGGVSGVTGWIVIGDFSEIDRQPGGTWNFAYTNGRIDLDAIRPQLQSISGLRIDINGQLTDSLTGNLIFRAGKNMRFTVVSTGLGIELTMDAIDGAGLNAVCVCADETAGDCVRTVNGIPPTPTGDFLLLGSDCIRLDTIANGLRFVDTCSDPCCGPDELEVITRTLETLDRQIDTLEHFVIGLEARAIQIEQSILASTFGDRSCTACPG